MSACSEDTNTLFRKVAPSQSNVHFINKIDETKNLNILNFHYIYNGGGVGVGDFNNDQLPDLVFSGNQVASKLYLNQGGLEFEDISDAAKFKTKGWATGVSVVDINGDGWQDIYLSVGGLNCDGNCQNQLFIHQGLDNNNIPTFKEMATNFGLADGLYTQQAAFFDYDLDGDLDVYLLHNAIDDRDKNAPSPKKFINENSIDKLFRNDGDQFTDVSQEMGIIYRGYGLGITINDINLDGFPDIYVANDFLSEDLVYINKGVEDGKHLGFDENADVLLKHQSYNSMGVDIADVNQDGLPDILTLDMMPRYHERQKTMIGFMNYNKFTMSLRAGYAPQFVRNTLQIHNGELNKKVLPFSEVGYLTGLYNTDWSWTPLMADFDNDGDRDIFITNGYGKDITDLDFINYSTQLGNFGTKEERLHKLYEIVQEMKEVTMPNFIFENKQNFQFLDQSDQWLKKENSISNGAVYSDLDNDGDLDLIVNNLNQKAFILENTCNQKNEHHYLKIRLKGESKNQSGIGAKIFAYIDQKVITHYQSPVRGYLSSVDPVVHIGTGKYNNIDSLKIVWPKGQIQLLKNIKADQLLVLDYKSANHNNIITKDINTQFVENKNLDPIKHQENIHHDFDGQRLLLQQHSKQGPCIAVANIDGQTGDEIFVGGAKGYPSQIYFPKPSGAYKIQSMDNEKSEDTAAAFFDFDNDGDLDLYIVSGGVEFKESAPEFQDRLLLNDGKGNFTNRNDLLPKNLDSGSCVKPCDYDQDGDIDLFIGGRVIPRKFPSVPTSTLLINHNGRFIDHTVKLAPDLAQIGMVADAIWKDIDGDDLVDLIVVGEWMPIVAFKNKNGILEKISSDNLSNAKGLWTCIATMDIDQDGDSDFLVGNHGLNSRLQASRNEPLVLVADDLDKNGSPDPIIGQYYLNKQGERKLYPLHSRDDLFSQLVKLKNSYVKYAEFANVEFDEMINSISESENRLEVTELRSCYLINDGKGNFEIKPLPMTAQISPIQCFYTDDFDSDGNVDALLVGNDFTSEKNGGWQDAQNGTLLKGNGSLGFEVISSATSGFIVPGDARSIAKFQKSDQSYQLLIGQNNDTFRVFDYGKN